MTNHGTPLLEHVPHFQKAKCREKRELTGQYRSAVSSSTPPLCGQRTCREAWVLAEALTAPAFGGHGCHLIDSGMETEAVSHGPSGQSQPLFSPSQGERARLVC